MEHFYEAFRGVVERHGSNLAVIDQKAVLTYDELSSLSIAIGASISTALRSAIGTHSISNEVIAVSLDPSSNLIASILGIIALGASYVPLDPKLSEAARKHIILTCNVKIVVDDSFLKAVETDQVSIEDTVKHNPTGAVYNIFTSGSTGAPKGVAVGNESLMNLLNWFINEFGMTSDSKVLQLSTINFDASIIDIFPTLLAGGTICIPDADTKMSVSKLSEFCRYNAVNQAFISPSFLRLMAPEDFETLKIVLTGGEQCSQDVINQWSAKTNFYNLYGPTECTVLATYKKMAPSVQSSNIGKPINGALISISDVDDTGAGELLIGGTPVALGYIANHQLTQEKFKPSAQGSGRFYSTGDYVRIDESGDLHFQGRLDRQVKIRGYRVELEEIESALTLVGFSGAAVKINNANQIIAYVELGNTPLRDGKEKLKNILASYKHPSKYVILPQLPLKANGKIDYNLLPEHREKISHYECDSDIKSIWCRTLKVDPSLVSDESRFDDQGGDSILIASFLSEINKAYEVEIDYIDFFLNQTYGFIKSRLENEKEVLPC